MHRSATLPADVVALIIALPATTSPRQGLDAGNATIALAPPPPPRGDGVGISTIHRYLVAAGLVTDPNHARNGHAPPTSGSKPNNPTNAWQADFTHHHLSSRHRHRDPHLARRPLPLRTLGHRAPPSDRPDRGRHLHPQHCRHPGHSLHQPSPTTAWCSPPASPAARAAATDYETLFVRLGVIQKNSRPEPPHHLRQGRTLPTDNEEMAAHRNPTSPPPSTNSNNSSTPSVDDLQPPTAPTDHSRHRSHPSRRLPGPTRKPPPTGQRRHPLPRVRHDRIRSGRVSLRVNGHMHHIGLGRTTRRNPHHPAHRRSRHPRHPRRHRRNHPHTSPSTPTKPLPRHRTPTRRPTRTPKNHAEPNPISGFTSRPGCLATSHSGTGGIRTPEPCGRPLSRRLHSSTLPPFRSRGYRATLRGSQERCQSGRMGRPAKALIAAM